MVLTFTSADTGFPLLPVASSLMPVNAGLALESTGASLSCCGVSSSVLLKLTELTPLYSTR